MGFQDPARPHGRVAPPFPGVNVPRPTAGRAVRLAGTADQTAARARYHHAGLVLAELAALTLWASLWLLNGYFTARLVVMLGGSWGSGWTAHCVISLLEHHLWRARRPGTYVLIGLVGGLDIGSSAFGLVLLGLGWGLPAWSIEGAVVSGLLASVIALAPEGQIVDHVLAIWRMARGGRYARA